MRGTRAGYIHTFEAKQEVSMTTEMKSGTTEITEVYFERVFNLGNYETMRIGLRATVGPGQSAEAVIEQLDAATIRMRNSRNTKG
jgi:hypothetical protein